MLEIIRKALRITGTLVDDEIQDTINACYLDMKRVGIYVPIDSENNVEEQFEKEPLVIACVKLYARWQFNFEDSADRYEKAYVNCRNGLALCGDYNA